MARRNCRRKWTKYLNYLHYNVYVTLSINVIFFLSVLVSVSRIQKVKKPLNLLKRSHWSGFKCWTLIPYQMDCELPKGLKTIKRMNNLQYWPIELGTLGSFLKIFFPLNIASTESTSLVYVAHWCNPLPFIQC